MSKKNIFAKFQDYVNKPKRNVFDLSFANNITTKFGQLTPVFCKECIPGDSFKIHSRFALQFMPMKFPVQTPMRAYLHFFYVRNRTLYKDWMDFIGGTKDGLVMPYVSPIDKQKFYRVGGLADYLGVPITMYSSEANDNTFAENCYGLSVDTPSSSDTYQYIACGANYNYHLFPYFGSFVKPSIISFKGLTADDSSITSATISAEVEGKSISDAIVTVDNYGLRRLYEQYLEEAGSVNQETNNYAILPFKYLGDYEISVNTLTYRAEDNPYYLMSHSIDEGDKDMVFFTLFYGSDGKYISAQRIDTQATFTASTSIGLAGSFSGSFDVSNKPDNAVGFHLVVMAMKRTGANNQNVTVSPIEWGRFVVNSDVQGSVHSDVVNIGDLDSTPYDSQIHLNALPFRAYEAIYNSYYRNAQNNPYVLNGVAEYNKYIPSYDGGSDTNEYDLHQRNWEYDFLTSAVQSPQQGDIAPLVGISVTGEATFQDENGNTYYASAQYDSDGNITGWTSHSPNMPQGSLRLLMDMAGTGISINDLRNVNAFQKFLENNIRRGLKYRDQIKSHFGVDVRYDELDMPEFIGGCSTDVNINKLSQTSESGNTPLGSFVGQASAYGESKHDITHYCDEHGFIIGILSIVPVPVYSQLLPKFFLKSEQLDYFFPEFGHIGYQPILQKEVSPLQTFYGGGDLNKVFGYQRAWYDYLDSTDEVHGQFRTTMRDFIMNRTFEDEPELSRDFLLVDADQLNDVFLAGTDDDIYAPEADKIIGSLYFNVSKKSPIPLFGIPRLD